MPFFYFHHQECGELARDLEGHDCADIAAAETHAVQVARQIIAREVLDHGELCLGCSVDIHDANNVFVTRVPFRRALLITGL